MTPFEVVYDAFLSKLLDDEWETWTTSDMKEDLFSLLLGALPYFKFPRQILDFDENFSGFNCNLSNQEIQILATYMKCEWLNRTILTWENVKPLYTERDFSQANLIDKFKNLLEMEKKNAAKLEAIYYRTEGSNKPFDYTRLAGSNG